MVITIVLLEIMNCLIYLRMPKMHKSPFNVRFIKVSHKPSVKSLARTIKTIFCLLLRKIQTCYEKCKKTFFTGVKTFWLVHNNESVIDDINKFSKRGKRTIISTFNFIPYILNRHIINFRFLLIDFCFHGG